MNIAKSGTISFQPAYDPATNRYSGLPAAIPAYDANGNVTKDGFHMYGWDAEGKNTQIDASRVGMTYDALGRWVERAAGGSFVDSVYAPDGSELALSAGQSVATAYARLPAGAVAYYLASGLNTSWRPDWLGTPRLYSGPARVVNYDVEFAPFGEYYRGRPTGFLFHGGGAGC